MEGRFCFYTYGTTLELNGVPYEAGRLTEDMLNLSREDYQALYDGAVEIRRLSEEYERSGDVAVWRKLNDRMCDLYHALRKYLVFRHLLGEEEGVYFEAVRKATGQCSPQPPAKPPEPDAALDELAKEVGRKLLTLNVIDKVPPPDLPRQKQGSLIQTPLLSPREHAMMLEQYGADDYAWEAYKKVIRRFQRYLLDAGAFTFSIRNFISILLTDLRSNNSENYAERVHAFYNDARLREKLMVRANENFGVGYTTQDQYVLSYVPRLLPDGTAVIAQEHVTDDIQAVLKADYMLALNSGHQIRRCLVCGRYFLLTSGVHALYCEGACPHAPRFTCRQFGTHEVQKELAKDVPKVRAKLQSFERITKDMQRGNITREDARKAKDYVRDELYDALRDPHISLEAFKERISSENVYAAKGIERLNKQRGRPRKTAEGEA